MQREVRSMFRLAKMQRIKEERRIRREFRLAKGVAVVGVVLLGGIATLSSLVEEKSFDSRCESGNTIVEGVVSSQALPGMKKPLSGPGGLVSVKQSSGEVVGMPLTTCVFKLRR